MHAATLLYHTGCNNAKHKKASPAKTPNNLYVQGRTNNPCTRANTHVVQAQQPCLLDLQSNSPPACAAHALTLILVISLSNCANTKSTKTTVVQARRSNIAFSKREIRTLGLWHAIRVELWYIYHKICNFDMHWHPLPTGYSIYQQLLPLLQQRIPSAALQG